jgi:A/G-specific adenine glycosylase
MAMTAENRWQRRLEGCERMCAEHGLSEGSKAIFRKTVRSYYREYGRVLPWRETVNPYHIIVSEIMLQQTQVDRVLAKYSEFIHKFADFTALNRAPLQSVLRSWQGLGYNRRARSLKMIARHVLREWGGILPQDPEQLRSLPGIGAASAGAIAAFAFNQPVVFIETNIRTVFLHFFFRNRTHVHDTEVIPYSEATLDQRHPRLWYWALMDFGVMIKRRYRNPARKSAHYARQSQFQGSDRYLRGQIIHILTRSNMSLPGFVKSTGVGKRRLQRILAQLEKERLIERKGMLFFIATDQ